MINDFIIPLLDKINMIYTCYYEEAPSNAKFPYLVIPLINMKSLDMGYSTIFDIEIYNNELSNQDIEEICHNVIKELDKYNFKNSKLGFHLNFENLFLMKSTEQDLLIRRITFEARIFI